MPNFLLRTGNLLDPVKDLFEQKHDANETVVRFSLRRPSHPEDDLCYIFHGRPDSLAACAFNSTAKTFLIIHGWTVRHSTWFYRLGLVPQL